MRWRKGRRSANIDDRRGASGGGLFGGRPRTRAGRVAKRGGVGGIGVIIIAVIAMLLGVDPAMILQMGGGGGLSSNNLGFETQQTTSNAPARSRADDELADFVSVVLADTEDVWHPIFKSLGERYQEPTLVLYDGSTPSACGVGQAAMGPFYCPADQQVYIDLSFFRDLHQRFGAPGDFAQAYVLAHEVGHHVQTLLGISSQIHRAKQGRPEAEQNRLSVMQELQADCFAGVWAAQAQRARNILEQGDLEEALRAAAAVGDDRLQQRSRGYVTPDSFTHGSADQRQRWFRTGLKAQSLTDCDTFNAGSL